jgi:cytochrome P450 family 6
MYAIVILVLIVTTAYLVNKYFFSYWSKRNVPQLEPTFLVGNIGKLFTFKETMADVFSNIYEKNKHHRFVGGYLSYIPMLIVQDPQLIQDVMIRDFKTFHDRPTPADAAEIFPLVGNLFNLRGQRWKNLRTKLSPAFSSGKLKVMFPFLKDCSQVLVDYVEKNIKNGSNVFDFKDLLARLTIDNISSVALGVENDCINDDNNMLYKIGLKIFEPSIRNAVVLTMAFFTPNLITKFQINPILPEVGDFIYSLVNQTVEHREKNKIQRNDFMQLLIELKNKGFVPNSRRNSKIDGKIDLEDEASEKGNRITIDDIAAQVFIFFGAGLCLL